MSAAWVQAPALAGRAEVVHGFSTRVGPAPGQALDLALRDGDPEALVARWEWALGELGAGVGAERLAVVSQVHGATVRVVDAPGGPLAPFGEADALVTTRPGLALAIRVADCVPIVLVSPRGVAAVHAGWRGVVARIVPAAVGALVAVTGDEAGEVHAAIGPCIGGAAYRVGEEVPSGLRAAGLRDADFRVEGEALRVDLARAVAAQLRAAGVTTVESLGLCTHDDPRFFSHRREGAAAGRQVALVMRRA